MNTCQRELYRVINTFLGRSKDMKPKGLCLTIKVRHVLLAQQNMPWSIIFVYLKKLYWQKIQGQLQSFGLCLTGVTQVRAGAEVGMVGKLGFCLCLVLYEVEKNCLKWLKSIFLLECACFFVFSLNTRNSRHLYSRLWMHEQDIP